MDSRIQAVLDSAWSYAPAPQTVRPCPTETDATESDDEEGEKPGSGGSSVFPQSIARYQRWLLVGLLALVLIWLWMPSSSSTPKEASPEAPPPPAPPGHVSPSFDRDACPHSRESRGGGALSQKAQSPADDLEVSHDGVLVHDQGEEQHLWDVTEEDKQNPTDRRMSPRHPPEPMACSIRGACRTDPAPCRRMVT
jgi:hypothetical protein